MDKMDKEVMSHVDADEFVLTDDEIRLQAFDVASEVMNNVEGLPDEHKQVVVTNARRIHEAVGFLLKSLDYTIYWRQ